jgi:hypothetical protein
MIAMAFLEIASSHDTLVDAYNAESILKPKPSKESSLHA